MKRPSFSEVPEGERERRWGKLQASTTVCSCKAAPGNPSLLLTHRGLGSGRVHEVVNIALLNF